MYTIAVKNQGIKSRSVEGMLLHDTRNESCDMRNQLPVSLTCKNLHMLSTIVYHGKKHLHHSVAKIVYFK